MLVAPLFSDEDADLRAFSWNLHPNGYAHTRKVPGRLAHRAVIKRKIGRDLKSGELTDHINRNKLDNRRENLRVGNKSINTINRDIRPDNKSGYIGVYLYWPKEWRKRGWSKRWRYVVQRKGQKTIYSKLYESPEQADFARNELIEVICSHQ